MLPPGSTYGKLEEDDKARDRTGPERFAHRRDIDLDSASSKSPPQTTGDRQKESTPLNSANRVWQALAAPRATDKDQARQEYMTTAILAMMGIALCLFTLPILAGWAISLFELEAVFAVHFGGEIESQAYRMLERLHVQYLRADVVVEAGKLQGGGCCRFGDRLL